MAKTIIRGSVTLSSKKCTVTVSSTEPLNPTEYTLWIDTENNNVLKRWENGRWVTINDKKEVIEYIHEELSNKYYDKTTTNELIKQIVGKVEITTDGKVSDDFKSLTTRIEESNSSFKQTSDEIVATVKSLKSTVGGEVYTSTPTVPYSEKDIWVDTDSSNNVTIKLCKNARTKDEKFYEADWEAIGNEKLDSYGMICTSAYSKVRQLGNKIDLLVSVDSDTSEITMTDKFINLISANINFDGVATFTNSVKKVVDSNYSLGMLDKITSKGSTTIDGEEIYSSNTEENLYARLKGGSLELFGGEDDDTKIMLNIRDGIHIDKAYDNVAIEIKNWGYDSHSRKNYIMESSSMLAIGNYMEATTTAYVGTVIGEGYISLFLSNTARFGKKDDGSYSLDYNNIKMIQNPIFYVDCVSLEVNVQSKLNSGLVVRGDTEMFGELLIRGGGVSIYRNTIDNTGIYLTNDGNDTISSYYKIQYTNSGMKIYNRIGDIVGSFCISDDYWTSELQAEHIKSTYDMECGTDLTVNGVTKLKGTLTVSGTTTLNSTLTVSSSTTLNSSLTVSGATTLNNTLTANYATTINSSLTVSGTTTHKSAIYLENNDNAFKNQITVMGMYFTSTGNSSVPSSCKTQYTVYGMEIRNRAGNVVGSFGHYNDYWSSKLQAEYIEATYEIQCGNQFRFKNSIYDAFYLELSAKYRDTESDLTSNPFPYLQFKQYSNILRVSPSIMNRGNYHGCCLGSSSIPFLEVRADNFYNSAGTSISSDKKVKKDILDIDDNFVNSLIDSISAKTYKYINGTSDRTHCGAIAQDIEDIIVGMGLTTQDFGGIVKNYKTIEVEKEDGSSELETDYESEPDYYLRYEEFIMPLVRYCQLLKQRIEVLEKVLIKDEESKIEEVVEVEETVKTEEIIETGEQNEN